MKIEKFKEAKSGIIKKLKFNILCLLLAYATLLLEITGISPSLVRLGMLIVGFCLGATLFYKKKKEWE